MTLTYVTEIYFTTFLRSRNYIELLLYKLVLDSAHIICHSLRDLSLDDLVN